MNLIIKNIDKKRAEEIVNELDKLIDEGIILTWTIDETEVQDYRSTDAQWGENTSIRPYYRNNSLCFAIISEDESDIKYANTTRFIELILTHFHEDVKVIHIINL